MRALNIHGGFIPLAIVIQELCSENMATLPCDADNIPGNSPKGLRTLPFVDLLLRKKLIAYYLILCGFILYFVLYIFKSEISQVSSNCIRWKPIFAVVTGHFDLLRLKFFVQTNGFLTV